MSLITFIGYDYQEVKVPIFSTLFSQNKIKYNFIHNPLNKVKFKIQILEKQFYIKKVKNED